LKTQYRMGLTRQEGTNESANHGCS
jgi:hypothetical protein